MREDIPTSDTSAVLRTDQAELMTLLVGRKRRVVWPLTLIFMTSYVGLTVLAGFARQFMAEKVVGAVNVGFVLIAANYGMSWVLALVYVRIANAHFDPVVTQIIAAQAGSKAA
jgi:uncharacterized membrane protein (DUF485 family)